MSEPFVEQADVDTDDADPALVTDEDRTGLDPLEDGMDTAEDYSRTMKLGGDAESEEQDTLAYRIPQEEPDPALEEIDHDPGRPMAATPIDDLDDSVDEGSDPALDGVSGVEDPLSPDGATEREFGGRDGEIELGVDSAAGSNEMTGRPADDNIGSAVPVENEYPTEGAEQQALRIEQES